MRPGFWRNSPNCERIYTLGGGVDPEDERARPALWRRPPAGVGRCWQVGDLPHFAHLGLRELVRGISALRVAGLRGLIAVRIGHPMV
jgi:hypothetical protein